MVDTVEISRVNIRDSLSIDVSVWMNHPNDMDFRPTLSVAGNTFTISSITDGSTLATIDLDEDQMEAVVRDEAAELRVKFQVRGMHGELKTIQIPSPWHARRTENNPPHHRRWKSEETCHCELEDHAKSHL